MLLARILAVVMFTGKDRVGILFMAKPEWFYYEKNINPYINLGVNIDCRGNLSKDLLTNLKRCIDGYGKPGTQRSQEQLSPQPESSLKGL